MTLITENTPLSIIVKKFPSLIPLIEEENIPCQGCHSPYTLPLKTLLEKFSPKKDIKVFIQELNSKIEDISNEQFSISKEAIEKIKYLAQKNNKEPSLRIIVKEGGCAGKEYKFEFENTKKDNDTIIKENNVNVYIDKESIKFLNGSRLEFINSLVGGDLEHLIHKQNQLADAENPLIKWVKNIKLFMIEIIASEQQHV